MQKKSESNNDSYGAINIIDSATLIAIATSCLYFFGYAYYMSYFFKLSIPMRFINIPLQEYFIFGSVVIFAVFFVIVAFFWAWTQPPSYKIILYFSNMLFFTQISILHYELFSDISKIVMWSLIIASFLGIFIFTIKIKESILYNMYNHSVISKIASILILFFIIFTVACFIGEYSAKEAIQGKHSKTQEIQLILNDDINSQMQNKSLILIMVSDSNYYIIEKNKSLTEYPTSYIIPNNQIKMSMLKAI